MNDDDGPLPVLIWIAVNLAALSTSLARVAAEVHLARRDLARRSW